MYFWNEILNISDRSSVQNQEFFTVHTAMVYVIQVMLTACEQDQDGTARKLSVNLYDGQRNCPKHIEFYSGNKSQKLMHLVGFIVRIKIKCQNKCSRKGNREKKIRQFYV